MIRSVIQWHWKRHDFAQFRTVNHRIEEMIMATIVKTRVELAAQTQQVGESLNELRNDLLAANKPFTAGIVRGAEEELLVAYTMLNDMAVKEKEL
jgi:hypothetical protein